MVGGMKVERGRGEVVLGVEGGRAVLLVGGGSGGHIYPNLAVAERLGERGAAVVPHLVVSARPLDAEIAAASGVAYSAVPASPLGLRPGSLLRFVRDHRRGVQAVGRLIERTRAAAVLCTGGFVSGPAVAAARRAGVPVALISLDAVPGKANRAAARRVDAVFAAFPPPAPVRSARWEKAEVVGYPLRRSAVGDASAEGRRAAQEHLKLDPARQTLLVFAGSQGARTINRAMAALVGDPGAGAGAAAAVSRWQVLHVAGIEAGAVEALGRAYRGAGVSAVVLPFCDRMDLAWAAADLGVTRAGAGTVAEAWANAVPCVMLPYPFHRDQHQRYNAAPLCERGGAVMLMDAVDPSRNVEGLRGVLLPLLGDAERRAEMRGRLRASVGGDGAAALADWVEQQVAGVRVRAKAGSI